MVGAMAVLCMLWASGWISTLKGGHRLNNHSYENHKHGHRGSSSSSNNNNNNNNNKSSSSSIRASSISIKTSSIRYLNSDLTAIPSQLQQLLPHLVRMGLGSSK